MSKRTISLRLIFACLTTFLVFLVLTNTRLYGKADDLPGERVDGITINLPTLPGGEEMPGVTFHHDLHMDYVKEKGKDCSVCHLKEKEDGPFVFKYMRISDTNVETDMAIYHDNCVSCHTQVKQEGKKSGPMEAQCRACHDSREEAASAWTPISFDKSLHNRHETAKSISPPMGQGDQNCGACHHRYDESADKIYYAKGEEDSCFYCHRSSSHDPSDALFGKKVQKESLTLKKASPMRKAAHNACVACHQKSVNKETAGPVDCKGCHDLEAQKKIKRIPEPTRLKRNQPDLLLITGWDKKMAAPEEILKAAEQHMSPVAFNHTLHEKASDNCRTCHHDALKSCRECHTTAGIEAGGFVKLETAMHGRMNNGTCIGCHNEKKSSSDCAGCHALMPEKGFSGTSDATCKTCHSVDALAIGLQNMLPDDITLLLQTTAQERVSGYGIIPAEKIPEKVVIGHIADQYQPTEFPHGRIVKAIQQRVEKSGMAKAFHKNDMTLCAGCHHNTPATDKPQKCDSCHGRTDGIKEDGRPGLKGAYHGQCIGCHQEMNIDAVQATDCNACHKEKR